MEISAFRRLTMAAGVPLGAITPSQMVASYPGTPASDSVGRSGMMAERVRPVVATALTLPAFTCSTMVGMASNIRSTWPPSTSVRACALPL